MPRKLSIGFLLFAWLCANGALLDIAQVVAWGKMFTSYSDSMNVGAALRETFDPGKPCELCVGIAQARDTQDEPQSPPPASSEIKLVLSLEAASPIVFTPPATEWPAAFARAASSRRDPVPLPPPRV